MGDSKQEPWKLSQYLCPQKPEKGYLNVCWATLHRAKFSYRLIQENTNLLP